VAAIVEYHKPGDLITYTVETGQSVTGGQMVALTGDREVRPAPADSLVSCGVALYDGAAGDKISVASEGVYPLTASGAITQGQRVKTGAAGVVVGIAADGDPRLIVGYALEDIADGASGRVKLTL
jgi:predicted RecA/RadA family phage recombinase